MRMSILIYECGLKPYINKKGKTIWFSLSLPPKIL